MTKVYQTTYGADNSENVGNCLQAVIASLFDRNLEDVPHFCASERSWFRVLFDWLNQNTNYKYSHVLSNPRTLGGYGNDRFNELESEEGVGGLFYATVYSPAYIDRQRLYDKSFLQPTHAVIIDKAFNIIHDPNINYEQVGQYPLYEYLEYNGIKDIYIFKKIKK